MFTTLMQFQQNFGQKVNDMSTSKGPVLSSIRESHNSTSAYNSSIRNSPSSPPPSTQESYSYAQGHMSRSSSLRESDRWSRQSGSQYQASKMTIWKETFVLLSILGVVLWLAVQ